MQNWSDVSLHTLKGLYVLVLTSLLVVLAPGGALPQLKDDNHLLFGEMTPRFKHSVTNPDASPSEKVIKSEGQILEGAEFSRGISTEAKNLRVKCDQRRDHAARVSCYRKSLSMATELNDPHVAAEVYLDLGATYKEKGEYGKAIECFELYLPIAAEMSDPRLETMALTRIADVHFCWGDNDKGGQTSCRGEHIDRPGGSLRQVRRSGESICLLSESLAGI